MANYEMYRGPLEELLELEAQIEDLKTQAEEIRGFLKRRMDDDNLEEVAIGPHIVRFTSILSSRFDTKRFKENFGEEVYKAYCKEIASKRFTIA